MPAVIVNQFFFRDPALQIPGIDFLCTVSIGPFVHDPFHVAHVIIGIKVGVGQVAAAVVALGIGNSTFQVLLTRSKSVCARGIVYIFFMDQSIVGREAGIIRVRL